MGSVKDFPKNIDEFDSENLAFKTFFNKANNSTVKKMIYRIIRTLLFPISEKIKNYKKPL
jgi:hypothetical protein